jgi:hypothetical protein
MCSCQPFAAEADFGCLEKRKNYTRVSNEDWFDRSWHTFSVRCAAVIPSGYRVTFVVLVTRLARELLTRRRPTRSSAGGHYQPSGKRRYLTRFA